jgi:predicted permease
MSSDAVKYFEDFIFLVSLPALIFNELAQFHLAQVDLAFLAANVIGMVVIYFLTILMCYPFAKRQLKDTEHGSLLAFSQAAIDGINAGRINF